MSNEKIKTYPKTDLFEVVDTITVPHLFCITPKHLEQASKMNTMYLSPEVIVQLEKETKRPSCGVIGCDLFYHQHEQALLIQCSVPIKNEKGEADERLRAYLISIKDQAERDGFVGFAFREA